jgi:hypothetical protein
MLFLQLPSPVPSSVQPNPTIPGGGGYPFGGGNNGGSYLNPANYSGLAHELGPAWFVLLIFTILLFLACGYMIWRSWKQPSNASQLVFLRAMYQSSNERHAQWQSAMRKMCQILAAIAKAQNIELNGLLESMREVLCSPPPIPTDILSVLDKDNKTKGMD